MKYSNFLEKRKKIIFDSMSKKRREQLLKKNSYKEWNPFEKPKKPIDIRTDKSNKTPGMLLKEFLNSKYAEKINRSEASTGKLLKIIIGLINEDESFIIVYKFSLWYNAMLENKNIEI